MFSIINYGKIRYFSLFSLNFRFASNFSHNFRLFYLLFRFRFLVFRIEVNHVKSGFFFASKRSEIFTSISNFASEAKVRAHPSPCCYYNVPVPAVNSAPTVLNIVFGDPAVVGGGSSSI